MRIKWIIGLLLALGLVMPGMASATHFDGELVPEIDCFGWTVSGLVAVGEFNYQPSVIYNLELVEEGQVSGLVFSGEYLLPFTPLTSIPFEVSGSWGDLCGTYTATGTFQTSITVGGQKLIKDEVQISKTFTCECEEEGCWLTPGYWKNHMSDPAWNTYFTIGGSPYGYGGIGDLMVILDMSVKGGDATVILAHHLIAAKLNVIAGNTDIAELDGAIADADAVIAEFGVGLNTLTVENFPVERQAALDIKDILEHYNELGCPGEDDEEEEEEFEDKALNLDPEQSTWGSLKSMYK